MGPQQEPPDPPEPPEPPDPVEAKEAKDVRPTVPTADVPINLDESNKVLFIENEEVHIHLQYARHVTHVQLQLRILNSGFFNNSKEMLAVVYISEK